MTLEQIEAHIQSANLDQYDKPQMEGIDAQQDLQAVLQRICKIYGVVKPILEAILNFPLIPASVKKALRIFMKVMDAICPA